MGKYYMGVKSPSDDTVIRFPEFLGGRGDFSGQARILLDEIFIINGHALSTSIKYTVPTTELDANGRF